MSGSIRPSALLDSMLWKGGINWRALGVGNILIALPLLHLAISALFLFGYCVGFGAFLARFVRPEDIFSMSISAVLWSYFIIAAQLAVVGFFSRSKPKSAEPSKGRRSRFHFSVWYRRCSTVLVFAVAALEFVNYLTGKPINAPLLGLVIVMQFVFHADRTKSGRRILLGKLLAFSVAIPVVLGMSYGQDDRHNRGQDDAALVKCGDYPVYRPIGGFLLGRVDKSHALLNEDCKVVLTVPDVRPIWGRKPDAVSRPAPQSPPSTPSPSQG